jgi:hypothetical protein
MNRPRKARIDGEVGHAMIRVLIPEEAVGEQSPSVFDFLVGDDDQGTVRTGRTIASQLVEKFGKGAFKSARFESKVVIELIASPFLLIPHRARSSEGRMSEGKDVQGPVRDRNGDVVGKVLGPIEADEPVDADIFLMSSPGTKGGMTGEVLTGEAVEAIEDGEAGTAEVSAHGTDAHGGDEEVLEGRVIDLSFSVVVEGE